LKASFVKRYGPPEDLVGNPDYSRIINVVHFHRIKNLVDSAIEEGAKIEFGGTFTEEDRFISPTIVSHVPQNCALMEEEIFGPVLPVVSYHDLNEAIEFINSRPRPLALYIFSRSDVATETILDDIPSGDAVVNDVVVHFGHALLPFGGIGASGMGKAHGRAGFEAFSHQRSILRQPKHTVASWLYPPYTRLVQWLIRFTVKYL
jgi:aldehyde dehydrogenase (NAD+)